MLCVRGEIGGGEKATHDVFASKPNAKVKSAALPLSDDDDDDDGGAPTAPK